MTNTELKAQIDSQITNETTDNSITPTIVGTNLKSVVDYIDQEVLSITPDYLEYVAKITKTGTGVSATFTLTEFTNTLGQTLIGVNDGVNLLITDEFSADFLNSTTTVEVWDINYLNTVVTKFSLPALSQVKIYSYYEGSQNINFSDNLFIRIKKY